MNVCSGLPQVMFSDIIMNIELTLTTSRKGTSQIFLNFCQRFNYDRGLGKLSQNCDDQNQTAEEFNASRSEMVMNTLPDA